MITRPVRRAKNRADWKFVIRGDSFSTSEFLSTTDFHDMLLMARPPNNWAAACWRAPTCAVKAGEKKMKAVSRVLLRLPARPGAAASQLEMVLWGDWGFR